MSYNREHIGNVKVSTGRLVLTDASTLADGGDVAQIAKEAPSVAAIVDDGGNGEMLGGLALAFGAPFANGEYPVFVTRNDKGEITSVEIQMEET